MSEEMDFEQVEDGVQRLGYEAYGWFEVAVRPPSADGTTDDERRYVRTKDGAPEWVRDLVYEAHGGMFPDDWTYEMVRDACEAIGEDGDEDAHAFADMAVDTYTSDRLNWLKSYPSAVDDCDEAQEEFGEPDGGIVGLIGMGQYLAASRIYGAVWSALSARVEELEAEEVSE